MDFHSTKNTRDNRMWNRYDNFAHEQMFVAHFFPRQCQQLTMLRFYVFTLSHVSWQFDMLGAYFWNLRKPNEPNHQQNISHDFAHCMINVCIQPKMYARKFYLLSNTCGNIISVIEAKIVTMMDVSQVVATMKWNCEKLYSISNVLYMEVALITSNTVNCNGSIEIERLAE